MIIINISNIEKIREVNVSDENKNIKELLDQIKRLGISSFKFEYFKNRVKEFTLQANDDLYVRYSSYNDILVILGKTDKYKDILKIIEDITGVKLQSKQVTVVTRSYVYRRDPTSVVVNRRGQR